MLILGIIICIFVGILTANREVKKHNCTNLFEYIMIVSWLWPFILLMNIEFKNVK